MTTALLIVSVAALAYFGVYWASLLVFVWVHGPRPKRTESTSKHREPVVILIPSHHEGEPLVDTVRTLIDQDYDGPIAIEVLVEDRSDSSVAALEAAYPPNDAGLGTGRDERTLTIVSVGNHAKFAKLNHALDRVDASFVAFLDADHRARRSWIRRAIQVLHTEKASGVQMRKRPLAANSVAQAWDAGLSHIGFELFNRASQSSFGLASFTGSTAVFRAEALTKHRLSDCITEDTFLSYEMLLAGHRIVYDERVGSYEEVTPNIPSFVFRRRRWAAGHTHAFFANMRAMRGSGATRSTRLLVFVLGQFFLLPVAVWLFFAVQGLYYFALFTASVRWIVLALASGLALALTLWLSWRRNTKLTDFIVVWLTLLPHVCMSGGLVYLLAERESFYFITSFPYQSQFWTIQAALVVGALGTFAYGWFALRSMRLRTGALFALTLPFLIFFDLLSALLGFSDMLLGRRQWSKIDRRTESSDLVDDELRAQLTVGQKPTRRRARFALAACVLTVLIVGVANEKLSTGQCGEPSPFLWDPIFALPDPDPALLVQTVPEVVGDRLLLHVRTRLRRETEGPITVRIFDEDRKVDEMVLAAADPVLRGETTLNLPLDWGTSRLRVAVSGVGLGCRCAYAVPRRVVEVSSSGLRVNGEPFLLKGMVPTFSAPGVGMTLDAGYAQLKSIGVNVVRIYHPPTMSIRTAARRHDLLLIPQPTDSTWESVDPLQELDRILYARRWRSLVRDTEGDAHVLMLNGGNELEIQNRSQDHVAGIASMLRTARSSHTGVTTYSTFATYIDYPVDVLGINMLDSGATYWTRALDEVAERGRPFFASEFGGFVAFFERTPPLLRQWRMHEQNAALARHGALGAVFFASHDNWSQSVPPGEFNDPFTGDHPDDQRGYWTPDNEAKPELEMLTWLLADASIEVRDPRVTPAQERVELVVSNRRDYRLEDLTFSVGGDETFEVGTLAPHEERGVRVSLASLRASPTYPFLRAQLSFSTHHGLEAGGRWRFVVPDPADGPVVVGAPLFDVSANSGRLSFVALIPGEARLVVPPDWTQVRIADDIVQAGGGVIPITLPSPVQAVESLEMSPDAESWTDFDSASLTTGDTFLRFRLPPARSPDANLVLAGLASTRVNFRTEDGAMFSASPHPYRETLVDVSELSGELAMRFRRSRTFYLPANRSPSGTAIPIEVEAPFVFAPVRMEIRRVP